MRTRADKHNERTTARPHEAHARARARANTHMFTHAGTNARVVYFLKVIALVLYIPQYPARGTVHNALHFTTSWQTCSFWYRACRLFWESFILVAVTSSFIVASTSMGCNCSMYVSRFSCSFVPGRTVSGQSSLLDSRPKFVLAYLFHVYCATIIHSHSHHYKYINTQLYSCVNWGVEERTKLPELRNNSKWFELGGSFGILPLS